MQLTQKHLEYWSRNLRVTAILLFIWFLVTFVMGYYARDFPSVSSAGRSRSGWRHRARSSSTW